MEKRSALIGGMTMMVTSALMIVALIFFAQQFRTAAFQSYFFASNKTSSEITKPLLAQEIFVSGIPVEKFNDLELGDFPELSTPDENSVTYHGSIYIASGRFIVKYDQTGHVLAVSDPDVFGCSSRQLAKIQTAMYVLCAGKGIAEIDLKTDKLVYWHAIVPPKNFSYIDGMAVDGSALWVATLDGLIRIDASSRQTKKYREELGIPVGINGTRIFVYNGDVWVWVFNGAGNGLARYQVKTDTWAPYTPEDLLGYVPTSTDSGISGFFQTTSGTSFAEYPMSWSKIGYFKYDAAHSRWEKMGSYTLEQPRPSFVRGVRDNFGVKRTNTAFELLTDQGWTTLPSFGWKTYAAISSRLGDKYYLLSNNGLEIFQRGDKLPRLLIPGGFPSSMGGALMAVSPSEKYVVLYTFEQNEAMENTYFIAHDFGIFDVTKRVFKKLRLPGLKGASNEQGLTGPIVLVERPGKLVLESQGVDKFLIDLSLARVSRIK